MSKKLPKKYPMTKEGYERLKKKLEELQERLAATIQEVRNEKSQVHITSSVGHGLISVEQERLSNEIRKLKVALKSADVIDPAKSGGGGRCIFGSYVDVQKEDGKKMSFQIVGKLEAEFLQGNFCSSSSPLGKTLLGKKEGDEIFVETPDGDLEYTLLAVRYEEMKKIISERVAEKAVEEMKEPEPQPAPVAVTAEKTAEPEETITEEIPAPVAPVGEAPAPSAPQEKTTFWTAALSWIKKLFK